MPDIRENIENIHAFVMSEAKKDGLPQGGKAALGAALSLLQGALINLQRIADALDKRNT